ncbi:MAG: hypothetical protein AAGF32_08400, partial [Pseudomonadota bacterium]
GIAPQIMRTRVRQFSKVRHGTASILEGNCVARPSSSAMRGRAKQTGEGFTLTPWAGQRVR